MDKSERWRRKKGILPLAMWHEKQRALSKERLASGKKVCAKCKELKSLTEFTRDISRNATADGYRTRCRVCIRLYKKNRYVKKIKKCDICIKIFAGRGKCCSAECHKKRKNEMERGYYYKNRKFFIAKNKLWERENIKKLGDKYIKRKLGIPDPPKELIELKREHLKAKRAIRTVLSQ